MTRDFTALFRRELDSAIEDVERRVGGHVVRNYKIAFGDPRERDLISIETAVERLMKDAPLLAPIIDISVVEMGADRTIVSLGRVRTIQFGGQTHGICRRGMALLGC